MSILMTGSPVAARKRKDVTVSAEADDSATLLSIKLSSDVVKTARIVAPLYDISMNDLICNILRPILKKMEDEGFEKRRRGRGE